MRYVSLSILEFHCCIFCSTQVIPFTVVTVILIHKRFGGHTTKTKWKNGRPHLSRRPVCRQTTKVHCSAYFRFREYTAVSLLQSLGSLMLLLFRDLFFKKQRFFYHTLSEVRPLLIRHHVLWGNIARGGNLKPQDDDLSSYRGSHRLCYFLVLRTLKIDGSRVVYVDLVDHADQVLLRDLRVQFSQDLFEVFCRDVTVA